MLYSVVQTLCLRKHVSSASAHVLVLNCGDTAILDTVMQIKYLYNVILHLQQVQHYPFAMQSITH